MSNGSEHDGFTQADAQSGARGMVREYVGKKIVDGQPVLDLRVFATSLEEAHAKAVEQYGEGGYSIWNKQDARRRR